MLLLLLLLLLIFEVVTFDLVVIVFVAFVDDSKSGLSRSSEIPQMEHILLKKHFRVKVKFLQEAGFFTDSFLSFIFFALIGILYMKNIDKD